MAVTKHGHAPRGGHTKTYEAWMSMKARCLRKTHKSYPNYGGRGITICPEWLADYDAFLRDMGEAPPGLTLERGDNNQGYSKANCYWASYSDQLKNTRRNHFLTFGGQTLCLRDWERKVGLGEGGLIQRLSYGWSLERALTEPPHPRRGGRQKRPSASSGERS